MHYFPVISSESTIDINEGKHYFNKHSVNISKYMCKFISFVIDYK